MNKTWKIHWFSYALGVLVVLFSLSCGKSLDESRSSSDGQKKRGGEKADSSDSNSKKRAVLPKEKYENLKQELQDFNNAEVLESAILAISQRD